MTKVARSPVGLWPPIPTGCWFNPSPGPLTTQALTLNLLYLWPMYMGACVVEEVQLQVSTLGASGVLRCGVWADLSGFPDMATKIWDANTTVSSASTGAKSWTGQSITFPGGLVWWGMVAQTAGCTVRSSTYGTLHPLILQPSLTPATNNAYQGLSIASISGALPTSGSPVGTAFTHPKILLQAA